MNDKNLYCLSKTYKKEKTIKCLIFASKET